MYSGLNQVNGDGELVLAHTNTRNLAPNQKKELSRSFLKIGDIEQLFYRFPSPTRLLFTDCTHELLKKEILIFLAEIRWQLRRRRALRLSATQLTTPVFHNWC